MRTRVFVTKYALTTGIEVHTVEPGSASSQILVGDKYVYSVETYRQQFVMGRNAFLTYKEAAIAARKMRDKKVVSIQKQLNRVKGLLFPTRMPDDLKES